MYNTVLCIIQYYVLYKYYSERIILLYRRVSWCGVCCLVSGVCIDRDVIRGSRANESEI